MMGTCMQGYCTADAVVYGWATSTRVTFVVGERAAQLARHHPECVYCLDCALHVLETAARTQVSTTEVVKL